MKNALIIICLCCFQFSCSTESEEPVIPDNPSIADLVFPYQNSLCNEGINKTPDTSTVIFEWRASTNTSSYTLIVTNLSTGSRKTRTTLETEMAIEIERAAPFEWYVISKSSTSTTSQSSKWKFYNASEGIQSYAPFPAEAVYPNSEQIPLVIPAATKINLEWSGSDIDDDIVSYDVYFGTTNPPSLLVSNLEDSILNDVPISSGTIYYWKIITKDSLGNSSDSGVFQFKVE